MPFRVYSDNSLLVTYRQYYHSVSADWRYTFPSHEFERKEVLKYGECEPFTADLHLFECAVDLVVEHLRPHVLGRFRDVDDLDLVMSGSPGYPYRLECPTRGEWLAKHRDQALAWVEGGDASDVWDCFGKLEVLPSEKALTKCRLVCGSGMRSALCGAALHETFNQQMSGAWKHTHSKVGFCKFYGGWDQMMSVFPRQGEVAHVDEADCKQWDSGMHGYLLKAVYDVRSRLHAFTRDNECALWDSFENNLIMSQLRLSDGSLWNTTGGNKSGSCNTSHDNTVGNLICLAYAWLRVGRPADDFHHFPFLVYGDDLLTGNLGTPFWDAYRECGIKLPSDRLKVGIPLSHATFLSQGTIVSGGRMVPSPSGGKYLYSCFRLDSKPLPDLQWERISSLCVEGYFSDRRKELWELMVFAADRAGVSPLTENRVKALWFGLEEEEINEILEDGKEQEE